MSRWKDWIRNIQISRSPNLSIIYAFVGWNVLALFFYTNVKNARKELTEEEKNGLSAAQIYALEMGRKDAKIVRLQGLSVEELKNIQREDVKS